MPRGRHCCRFFFCFSVLLEIAQKLQMTTTDETAKDYWLMKGHAFCVQPDDTVDPKGTGSSFLIFPSPYHSVFTSNAPRVPGFSTNNLSHTRAHTQRQRLCPPAAGSCLSGCAELRRMTCLILPSGGCRDRTDAPSGAPGRRHYCNRSLLCRGFQLCL